MHKIIAVVGMCGSGKSIACDVLREAGWHYIRFGQLTIDRLLAAGKAITPGNEREMREELRRQHGMAAFALLSLPEIETAALKKNVVIDGLYSWAEYKILKEKYAAGLEVLAIYTPPALRYSRLASRVHDETDTDNRNRVLTPQEARERDYAEIEKLEKGGPIAMADCMITNTAGPAELARAVRKLFCI